MKLFKQCYKEFFLQAQTQELYKYEESLNSLTLQFISEELELSYQNRQMAKVIVQFRISILLQILINIGFIINSAVVYNSPDIVKFRLIFIGWMLICLFLQKISRKYWNITTNILNFINSVISVLLFAFFTKFVNTAQTNFNDVMSLSLISGLQQGLFAMSFFLIQSNYIMQSLTMLSFFIIIMGIFTQFLNYRLWTQYLLLIFTCYLLRQNEKTNRLNFLLIHKSHKNLEACKKLYDETVPTSIIILEENIQQEGVKNDLLNSAVTQKEKLYTQDSKIMNVAYFNKSASIHFETAQEDILTERLNEIEISNSENSVLNCEKNKLLEKIQGLQSTLQTEMRFNTINQFDYQIMSINKKMQCQRVLKQQKVYYYDAQAQGCLWDGKQCIMLILNDTTDRVLRIKHLQELDNYKDNLLAAVSHDLKTPLNGQNILANLIKTMMENKQSMIRSDIQEIVVHIDDMISNQQILLTMINDLIDYSQLKKQGLRLNYTQFDLSGCVQQIQKMFKRQMDLKQLQFKIVGLDEQIIMFTDQIRLQQILYNLISNAIKFTYNGFITLKIQKQISNNQNLINFSVQDTGIGIPMNIQTKLFKAYSTFNLGNKNSQGVGLGLVISRNLVGLLGPNEFIEMSSIENKGSNFSFSIYLNAQHKECNFINTFQVDNGTPDNDPSPIHKVPNPLVKRPNRKYQTVVDISTSLYQKLKILIVDDTIFNIYALKQLLKQIIIQCDIHEAHNGLEALEKVQGIRFDIIFMDINMPTMNGIQATQEIRQFEKNNQFQRSIICMLSAFQGESDLQESLRIGADLHLSKPFQIIALKTILKQFNLN
ncbi:unnamed protein product [Paramecium sonneborni]|uniref:Uncharacterized protein n=1 Tax=Paramecium sonneborni TaxID=65129 RepID=A0A8S1P6K0_9CILI|nr:unnamed protein product [Paramecium sonneborni]